MRIKYIEIREHYRELYREWGEKKEVLLEAKREACSLLGKVEIMLATGETSIDKRVLSELEKRLKNEIKSLDVQIEAHRVRMKEIEEEFRVNGISL